MCTEKMWDTELGVGRTNSIISNDQLMMDVGRI